jgi:hypothetical protein
MICAAGFGAPRMKFPVHGVASQQRIFKPAHRRRSRERGAG